MANARQAGERVIDAPCPNFPKCLVFGSRQCYSSTYRWVHCLSPPVLWPLFVCCSTPLAALWCPWRVTLAGPIDVVVGCLQLLPVVSTPEGPWTKAFLKVESSFHDFAASMPGRWTRHRRMISEGERWYPPIECKREMQPAGKKGETRPNP